MPQHDAIAHLDTFGYCLIEDAIPAAHADAMAEKYFQLHRNPANRDAFQDPDDEMYQTLFGVVNLDEMCWGCIAHPQVLQVIRHFLGDNARLGGGVYEMGQTACTTRRYPFRFNARLASALARNTMDD